MKRGLLLEHIQQLLVRELGRGLKTAEKSVYKINGSEINFATDITLGC